MSCIATDTAFPAIAGGRCSGPTAGGSTRYSPLSGVSAMNSARSTGHRRRSSFPSPRREGDSPNYHAGRLAPELRSARRSASAKLRFALFHEGPHALLQVVGNRTVADADAFLRELLRDRVAQSLIHQPLGLRDGDRRCERESLEDLFRSR